LCIIDVTVTDAIILGDDMLFRFRDITLHGDIVIQVFSDKNQSSGALPLARFNTPTMGIF